MKKMIQVAAIVILASTVSASVLKICVKQANGVCKGLQGQEFYNCHNSQMDFCMNDLYGTHSYDSNKSDSAVSCEAYCATFPETTMREICLMDCE